MGKGDHAECHGTLVIGVSIHIASTGRTLTVSKTNSATVTLAVLSIYVLDFAINAGLFDSTGAKAARPDLPLQYNGLLVVL